MTKKQRAEVKREVKSALRAVSVGWLGSYGLDQDAEARRLLRIAIKAVKESK